MKQNPYACGDGGCVLLVPGVPVGMHTNAGCRCIPLKMTPNERVRLRNGIRWLAERLSKTEGEPVKPVLKVSEDGKSAFLGTSGVIVSPIIMESTPRKKPSKIEFLWLQCSQCGWGQRMAKAEAEVDEWEDGSACPHCGVGPIRSSPMGRFR